MVWQAFQRGWFGRPALQQDKTPETRPEMPSVQADRLTAKAARLARQAHHPQQAEALHGQAMDVLSQALEYDPDHGPSLALLARLHFERAHFDKARQLAHKALAQQGCLTEARLTLARLALLQREPAQARQWGWQALWQARPSQWPGVCRTLTHAYAMPTDHPGTRLSAVARGLMAWLLTLSGLMLTLLLEGRGLLGVWGSVMLGGFRAMGARFHRDDAAEKQVWQALQERFPGLASLQVRLGDVCLAQGDSDEAEGWYRRALKRHPLNATACDRLASLFEATEQLEDAAVLLTHLLAIAPARVDAYRRLGDISAALGDLEQASAQYQTFVRLCRNPHARALQAATLAQLYHDLLDNPLAAQLAMGMAIAAEPRQVDHYLQLGAYYYEAGLYADAERVYTDALRLAPSHVQALACLGYFKWQTGEIEAAVGFYTRALAQDPDYDIACNNLGVIYLDHLGRMRDAMALFERAVFLNPRYALAFYNLGRAHHFLGERERAVRCFEQARQINDLTGELDGAQLDTLIHALSQSGGEG